MENQKIKIDVGLEDVRRAVASNRAAIARLDEAVAALKAEIHELQRNAAGGGITG